MSEPTNVTEALAELHERCCAPDQHDPLCRLLIAAIQHAHDCSEHTCWRIEHPIGCPTCEESA